MQCDIDFPHLKFAWHVHLRHPRRVLQVNVKHLAAVIAAEVRVLTHVGAEQRRATIHVHLPHDAALHEGVEAVVHRGHGNLRFRLLGPHEHLLGGGMIAKAKQHLVNVLPLGSGSQALLGKSFIEGFAGRGKMVRHHVRKVPLAKRCVNTWNNSNLQLPTDWPYGNSVNR